MRSSALVVHGLAERLVVRSQAAVEEEGAEGQQGRDEDLPAPTPGFASPPDSFEGEQAAPDEERAVDGPDDPYCEGEAGHVFERHRYEE